MNFEFNNQTMLSVTASISSSFCYKQFNAYHTDYIFGRDTAQSMNVCNYWIPHNNEKMWHVNAASSRFLTAVLRPIGQLSANQATKLAGLAFFKFET